MGRWGVVASLFLCASCSLGSLDGFSGGGGDAGRRQDDAGTGAGTTTEDGGADGGPDAMARADAAAFATATSCKDVLQISPTASDGYFLLMSGEVYCDMTTGGGGWTLVARTASGAPKPSGFGWRSATGGVHADEAPYSLGVLALDLPFTEVLVGQRDIGKRLAGSAFKLGVSRADLMGAGEKSVDVKGLTTVLGGCNPAGGPTMFLRAGYSNRDTRFHFRDIVDEAGYGVFPDAIGLAYGDCAHAGNLDQKQGELFVR